MSVGLMIFISVASYGLVLFLILRAVFGSISDECSDGHDYTDKPTRRIKTINETATVGSNHNGDLNLW